MKNKFDNTKQIPHFPAFGQPEDKYYSPPAYLNRTRGRAGRAFREVQSMRGALKNAVR